MKQENTKLIQDLNCIAKNDIAVWPFGYLNQIVAAMSMWKNLVDPFPRKFFSYRSFRVEIENSRNGDWNLKHATFHNNPSQKLTRPITWDEL